MEYHESDEFEHTPWWKGPLGIALALFMIFIFILTVVPTQTIKADPHPGYIPTIEEVYYGQSSQENFTITDVRDFYNYLSTDGDIKRVADNIAVAACEGDRVCYAKAMFYFVRDNVQYVNDPVKFEFAKEPGYTLEVGAGDCDDSSILLSSLLRSVGIETRFVFIPRHVYVQAKIPEALNRYQDDGWVNLDATCGDCEFGSVPYKDVTKTFI